MLKKVALWYSTVLSLATALAYVLSGTGTLTDGLGGADENPPAIFFVAAGFYAVAGGLVHVKKKWIRLSLGCINALVILIFFQMWAGEPDVLTSPAGLSTKIIQILLEIGLIYLIIKTWKEKSGKEA